MTFTSIATVSVTNNPTAVVTKRKKVKVSTPVVTMPEVVQWNDYNVCIKLAEQWDQSIPDMADRSAFFIQVFQMTDTKIYSKLFPEQSSNIGRYTISIYTSLFLLSSIIPN